MHLRHEVKHEISRADMLVVRRRLQAAAQTDKHAADGVYRVRSLYFDTPEDTALHQKLDGISRREKFRIRYYNSDTSFIRLEKKMKTGGLCAKQSVGITAQEAQRIVCGDIGWMADCGRELLFELYTKMKDQRLAPKTIVDYTREPFVYAPGNVRVTLDYDIRTGVRATDLLDGACPTVAVSGQPVILEVKWDEFLPDIIRSAVQLDNRRAGAYSKYAAGRIYG